MRNLILAAVATTALAAPAFAQTTAGAPFTGLRIEGVAGYDALKDGHDTSDGFVYGGAVGYDVQLIRFRNTLGFPCTRAYRILLVCIPDLRQKRQVRTKSMKPTLCTKSWCLLLMELKGFHPPCICWCKSSLRWYRTITLSCASHAR